MFVVREKARFLQYPILLCSDVKIINDYLTPHILTFFTVSTLSSHFLSPTVCFLPQLVQKKCGSLMCSLLQRGQRLGERIALLLLKVNPQARHSGGVIPKLLLRDLCTCSKCTYTSFWGMRMVLEISCAVHSPVRSSSIISFLIVM